MKKTLLTAALVAGFASVAHAESSVTLYGVVDGGVGYSQTKTTLDGDFYALNGAYVGSFSGTAKTSKAGVTSGNQSGNRWGLKGVEDLGNGTSAIFQLESGFSIGDGQSAQGGRLFGRKAILGLTSESWGTLTAGRQYNVGDDFLASIDPFGTGFGQAGATNVLGTSWSGRYDASIKYMTPNFSGFQAAIMWSGANSKDDLDYTVTNAAGAAVDWDDLSVKTRNNLISLGLAYNNGPIQAGLVWDHQKAKTTVNGNSVSNTVNAWNLGFAYDFDVVKLHLGVGQQKDGLIRDSDGGTGGYNDFFEDYDILSYGNAFGKGYRQTHWLVGLSAPVGENGKVLFSYAGAHGKNLDAGANGFGWEGRRFSGDFDFAGEGKLRSNVFSLGYTHNLSKRTNIYAVASYGTYKTTADGSVIGNISSRRGTLSRPVGSADATYKAKATQINIGLRHRF